MKQLFLTFLAFTTAFSSLTAQHLKRKGGLGIGYFPNLPPDTLATRIQYQKGAVITFVMPNTTAASVGLQKDDIITRVNDTNIDTPPQIAAVAKNLREGDDINISLIRNKTPMTLTGKVVPRPKESSPNADVVYGEFAYKNGYVRTIYKTLKGKKPLGTIYFLQGLPCYSMDNFQPLDKTKQALDAMVERGFAVYRMEKGDMGDNSGFPPCETMGYHDELAMYEAGYKHLLTLPEVEKDKILLFGHSMGGTTAPLLAQKFQPKGVVVYGTGFKPWAEYLCDAFLIQPQLKGFDLGELRESLEKFKPHLYDFFYTDKSVEEITKNPMGMMALRSILDYKPQTQQAASGRHILTFKELNQYNVAKAWGAYQNHTLAIYGECDQAANNADDHKALVDYVNKKRPGHGTFWLAPRTTHTFEEIGTMEEFVKWQTTPQAYVQYAATRFNPKVFDYACNWMKEILEKPQVVEAPVLYKDGSDDLPEDGTRKASMDVKATDIDGDGDLDILLANEFQPNSILINDGKGRFTDESKGRLPQVVHDSEDVAVADFNGDGLPDLVFCSEDDKIHEFYLNTGKGFFKEAPYQFPNSEANAVVTADLNKDGKPDVIFGNNGQNTIFVNKGNGTFAPEPTRLPALTRVTQDLALFDADGDGDWDMIEGNEDGNALYFNNGKGVFKDMTATHLPATADMETRKVSYADVDKDGDLDVFLSNVAFRQGKNPQNRLYINDGKGKFTDQTSTRLPTDTDHTIDAIFEDVNADGAVDIVVANVFGAPVKIYVNDGKGVFSDKSSQILGQTYQLDALGVIAADLNGDGLRDLYLCDRHNPAIDNKDLLLLRSK